MEGKIISGSARLSVLIANFFLSFQDEETITSAWDRFRVTPRKLRIKGVLAEDGGVYKCKGTNGFGSKELSTRLLVEGRFQNTHSSFFLLELK